MISVKRVDDKVYVYDPKIRKGRYYKMVPEARDEHYIALFLKNEDKIRKKGAKYINELVQGEKEARNKRKVSEKRILAISNNERKKKQRIRELLEPYKHGSVIGQYSEQYFDDIGLHRKLFAQVLKNENDEDRVMKRRKYLKDLMELTVELKGHDDVEQKDNVSMVVIKLYNTDLEI